MEESKQKKIAGGKAHLSHNILGYGYDVLKKALWEISVIGEVILHQRTDAYLSGSPVTAERLNLKVLEYGTLLNNNPNTAIQNLTVPLRLQYWKEYA